MQTDWAAVRRRIRRHHSEVPRWARLAYGLSVLMLVLLPLSVLSWLVLFRVGELRPSVSTATRLLLWLVAIVCVRYLLVPSPTLLERLWGGVQAAWRSRAIRATLPVFLSSRLTVLLIGYLAVVTIGYPGTEPPLRVSPSEWRNLPMRWDAGWYLQIATAGYRWTEVGDEQQSVAFFPAYPLLMRTIAVLGGTRPEVGEFEAFNVGHLRAGMAISFVAFWGALLYLYLLARDRLGRPIAAATILLLATYPFGVFFSAVYTESLMLLGCVATFYHSHRGRWTAAALWGLLVGLTRPNGFLLSVPVAVLAWNWLRCQTKGGGGRAGLQARQARLKPRLAGGHETSGSEISNEPTRASGVLRATLAVAAPVAGLLVYCAFLYVWIGRPFAWLDAHAAWGRSYTGFSGLVILPRELSDTPGLDVFARTRAIDVLNAMAAGLTLVAVWPLTKRLGLAYGLFVAMNIVPPLAFGGLLSMGRMTSILFPIFLYLAVALPRWSRMPVACGFACLQGLAAALFFTWRPMY